MLMESILGHLLDLLSIVQRGAPTPKTTAICQVPKRLPVPTGAQRKVAQNQQRGHDAEPGPRLEPLRLAGVVPFFVMGSARRRLNLSPKQLALSNASR
jgi:hypothetical protein